MLGLLGFLPVVIAAVAVGMALVSTGVSIWQAAEQKEMAQEQKHMQKEATKKNELRQFQSQTAQKFRQQEEGARVRMAAGSEAKINEFMTERAKNKSAHQLEILSKNEYARAERYAGTPVRTIH